MQHYADLGGGSDWFYLNHTTGIAAWLCILALISGVVLLIIVWWKGHRSDNRLA